MFVSGTVPGIQAQMETTERQVLLREPTVQLCLALRFESCPEPVLLTGILTSSLPLLYPVAHTPTFWLGSCSEENEHPEPHGVGSDTLTSSVNWIPVDMTARPHLLRMCLSLFL